MSVSTSGEIDISLDHKPDDQFVEHVKTEAFDQQEDYFSDVDEAKVLRKIDLRLLPLLSLLYLLENLDRGNIGNALLEGLEGDLGLEGNQFNLCLTIFFITYSICEIPSNYMLKIVGKQSIYIPTIMTLWGLCLTFMGLVKNFAGLFALRFVMGIFESGFYPGVTYGLTMWYAKGEMQSRQAIFYCFSSVAYAFSGLLAAAIGNMSGVGGYLGWRWIFILEGLFTVVVSICSFWLLPDYPDTAKFLTEREREFVLWRLKTDNNYKNANERIHLFENSTRAKPDFTQFTEDDDIPMRQALFAVIKDPSIYFHVLLYWGIICPQYAIAMFLPSVLSNMGYSNTKAQLMSVPVYITGPISAVIQAFIVDRIGYRSWFILGNLVLVVTGFSLTLAGQLQNRNAMIYGSLFMIGPGLVGVFPGIISWVAVNFTNPRKRAIAMAFQLGLGNFGGAAACNFYTGNFATGHALALAFSCLAFINAIILMIYYSVANKKAKDDLSNGKYDDVTDLELFRMGNRSPFFSYNF